MLRRLRGFAPGVIAFWKAVALAASVPSVDPTDSATLISRASSLEGLSTCNSFSKAQTSNVQPDNDFRVAAPTKINRNDSDAALNWSASLDHANQHHNDR
jgi:hypothetical protein